MVALRPITGSSASESDGVFEPIVGFNAEAHATSLSWFIFNDLGGETRLFSSAAASSVLTIIGVAILLSPVLLRTWRDFRGKA